MQIEPKALKDLTKEEELVYRIVSDSQLQGIKVSDIGKKSGMTTVKINKILHHLSLHDFIQPYKKPDQKAVKLWYLFELNPGEEYKSTSSFRNKDGQINQTLVRSLCDQAYQFVEQQLNLQISLKQMQLKMKATSPNLKDPDIKKIVDILVFEAKLEYFGEEQVRINRFGIFPETIMINNLPCGACPVFNICSPGNAISPENCIYYELW